MWPPHWPPVAVIGQRYSSVMRSRTPRVARASQMTSGGNSPLQQSMCASGTVSRTLHAGGVARCAHVAALVLNPPPWHKPELAQPHGCVADVLRGCAGAFFAGGVAVDFRDDALLLQLVIGTGRWSGWCLRARAAVVRRGMRAAVVPPLTLALIARLREYRCRAISLPRPLAVPPRPLAGRVQDNAARAAGQVVGVEPARGAAVITKRRGAVAAPAFAYKRN